MSPFVFQTNPLLLFPAAAITAFPFRDQLSSSRIHLLLILSSMQPCGPGKTSLCHCFCSQCDMFVKFRSENCGPSADRKVTKGNKGNPRTVYEFSAVISLY